ncbi:hypothetical protein BDZ91DRAFT_744266 [Kalaharituber pfeilii]|nr:hypothetical protein BDZ91DRAFT_744266 [Kalaharituber pfeilii]
MQSWKHIFCILQLILLISAQLIPAAASPNSRHTEDPNSRSSKDRTTGTSHFRPHRTSHLRPNSAHDDIHKLHDDADIRCYKKCADSLHCHYEDTGPLNCFCGDLSRCKQQCADSDAETSTSLLDHLWDADRRYCQVERQSMRTTEPPVPVETGQGAEDTDEEESNARTDPNKTVEECYVDCALKLYCDYDRNGATGCPCGELAKCAGICSGNGVRLNAAAQWFLLDMRKCKIRNYGDRPGSGDDRMQGAERQEKDTRKEWERADEL